MAKLSFEGTAAQHKGHLKRKPWCLCLGAGASIGLIPSWQQLTQRVVRAAFDTSLSDSEISQLLGSTGWSFESWIQAGLNYLVETGKGSERFFDLLERELYTDLLEAARNAGLREVLSKAFNNPLQCSRQEIEQLWLFFEQHYKETSALPLARVLVRCIESGKSVPKAILNFNADTIVHTLFSIYHILQTHRVRGRWEFPKQIFKRIFYAIQEPTDRIPIYHLHGCILPPTKKRRDSRERLIFPETDYTEIAGSVFSWSQTTFLYYAQSYRLVFVGHSLSDPNIRKWLSWSTKARFQDPLNKKGVRPTTHIWFANHPKNDEYKRIIEHSLIHLGTRICWLNNWSEIERAFINLLAIDLPREGPVA